MFAAKLFLLAAVLLAVTQVDAKKHKKHHRRHHKKERIVDAVTRHCNTNQATFVVDGISTEFGKKHLKECPLDISMTILLGRDDLRSRRLVKLVKYAVDNGHSLAYRFDTRYDRRFQDVNTDKMVEKLTAAKDVFQANYEYELNYVYLPAAKHHLTAHVDAIEGLGLTPFGNALWVDKHFRKTSRSSVKHKIKNLAKHNLGAIVYLNGHNGHLLKDMDIVYDYLHDHKLEVVNMETCLATVEEVVEPVGEQAEAKIGEEAKEEETSAAAGITVSAVLAGAAAVMVAFAL